MRNILRLAVVCACLFFAVLASAQTNHPHNPTWWAKFEQLVKSGAEQGGAATASLKVDDNVDVSNECGPQSETYITLNPNRPRMLTAGSNEIFRLPMRAYFSSDGGRNWSGVDLPLPPPLQGTNDTDFGSDPTLAYDTLGNVFYGYIVVFFGNGSGVNGTEMAVARSTDGGKIWSLSQTTFFSLETGSSRFNDKPMITADTNPKSPFRDNVYIAWDAAVGGTTGGGIRVGSSSDNGATFTVNRADNPSGPGQSIGAVPFVGPKGELYVAWNDFANNVIAFNRSLDDGGLTFGQQVTIASKVIPFDIGIPAEFSRRALVYPACDADRSSGSHRGRLYCAWMDIVRGTGSKTQAPNTQILLSSSDNMGTNWSAPQPVGHQVPGTDRFNQWLSVDPVTGDVSVSYYDTQNDTTGQRFMTDVFLSRSTDGGVNWVSDVRVTTESSNEHDCNGLFPCPSINYGNQQGDYEGLVSFGGVSHPIWTDSRRNQAETSVCGPDPRGLLSGLMEEVFTATIK